MADHNDTPIIRFQSRTASAERNSNVWWDASSETPDNRREAAPESDQEYRERMRANYLSAIVIAVLVSVGTWTLNSLVEAQQPNHGCYRAADSCRIIEIPIARPGHWQWS
jgi:hypothetical protein